MSSNDPSMSAVDYDPFAQGELERVVATTEPQREVWLADQLGRDASLAYNESVSLRLRGPLDLQALRESITALVARHEALRATISSDGLSLCIGAPADLDIPLVDLCQLTAEERERGLRERQRYQVDTPFDLSQGPLFRGEIVRLDETEHVLILGAHHIVCDGWSYWVIVKELGSLYAQKSGAASSELGAPDSFADYALSQEQFAGSSAYAEQERFWLERFPDVPPALDLPLDRPRPLRRTQRSDREDYLIGAELIEQVRAMGTRHRASLFTTLLAAFNALLVRLTGQTDLVVGIPAAGQAVEGHNALVGHCVNLLPLRSQVDSKVPFSELLKAVRGTMFDAYDHQQYTFGTLLKQLRFERDPARLPLVSVLFNIDQALDAESAAFPKLSLEFTTNPRTYENFELFINAAQVGGALRLECQYNSDLFDKSTIVRWMSCFEELLRQVSAAPDTAVSRLRMLIPSDRALLDSFNATARAYPREQGLHELVQAQARQTPERTAIRVQQRETSYADLEARSNQIARALRARGVRRGTLVGLCLERTEDMVASLLAVLKAGGAYLPLDPSFPSERLAFMVEDSGMALVVSQSNLADRHGAPQERTFALDAADAVLQAESAAPLPRDQDSATPEDPAYVLYTSGSTGKPKGVRIPHRAAINFLVSMQDSPGLGPDDRLVAVTTLSFDISLLELLLPLTVGAQIILASRDQALEGTALRELVESTSATVMQATPATWRILIETGWRGTKSFKALCGGEALTLDLAEALLVRTGELWNMYGPTETTVWSACWQVRDPGAGISIGRPIANTSVWVLDSNLEPCPVGVPGELYIGGDGLALGYLNRPELTRERFVEVALDQGHPTLLYKTGDLGRWRSDGLLVCLGRTDSQVKVRGYRIELGEIEAAIASHPGIRQVVVLAREDRASDVRLVAYVVAGEAPRFTDAELRTFLRKTLPDYMVPQHFMLLDAIPTLPNGKVDRKRLPAPSAESEPDTASMVEPSTELERLVAGAFARLLNVSKVSVHDSFFERGGHSLLAAQLIAQLNRELQLSIPMRAVFEAPTAAGLTRVIEQARQSNDSAQPSGILRRADQSRAPLSLMQQRVWFLEQLHPGNVMFNTPSTHRLLGDMDTAAFQRAFNEMVRRQSSLRTTIRLQDGEPVQVVRPELFTQLLPPEDLTFLPPESRDEHLRKRVRELTLEPFDFAEGPLFRARLFVLGPDDHAIVFVVHHIVWDGWSFDLFYEEMSTLYEAFRNGRSSPLPELPVSYGDFAVWQRDWLQGETLRTQIDYWKEHLAGHRDPLELPSDRPRPPEMSGMGLTEWVQVSRERTDALRALGLEAGATLFMTLLSAFYVFLWQTTRQTDLVLGTPVRGRSQVEVEKIMGFFVNALALRQRVDPEQSFLDFLRAVRKNIVAGFGCPDVPFEHLVRELKLPRDESRFPIYQAFFSFQDVRMRPTTWGNLQHARFPVQQAGLAEDLSLWFVERPQGLMGALLLNADIFDSRAVRRYRERYGALLTHILEDPRRPIGDLSLLGPDEQREITSASSVQTPYDRNATLAQLFEAQADRTPHRTALRFRGATLTYEQVERRANQLARLLRERGVRRSSLVGVSLERSVDMLVAVLAVQKAGGAYLPLDPAFPTNRLAFQREDANLALVISASNLASRHGCPSSQTVEIDRLQADLGSRSSERLPADELAATADDVAYVLYTSGSTGKPKGVQVQHRAAVNFLNSMRACPGLGESDRLVAVTTLSFDISLLELMLPLSVGAEVVLASSDETVDGQALRRLLESSQATVMQATPVTWRFLIDAGWRGTPTFKALCGGEPLPVDLAEALLERTGELWNMYGPTETTVWSSCWKVQDPRKGIFIGRPIANTTIRILDERQHPCPIGIPGEILIGGDGLAKGYLNRDDLTAERFVPDPLSPVPGQRLYKTGDLGRWREGGLLECLGRTDLQVKVRGHRIELGEIEASLAAHPSIRQAVVVVRGDPLGDRRLVAYVISSEAQLAEPALREHLRKQLPEYMVPQHFVRLEAFPTTPNGKVDRKALPEPTTGAVSSVPHQGVKESLTATEAVLADVWKRVLNVPYVQRDDNFFDLGGHSLLAMQAIAEIDKKLGKRVGPRGFIFQTLAQVAASYDAITNQPTERAGLLGRVLSRLGKNDRSGSP